MSKQATISVLGVFVAGLNGFGQQPNPERDACLGATYIHTGWSADAGVFGNRIAGPAEG